MAMHLISILGYIICYHVIGAAVSLRGWILTVCQPFSLPKKYPAKLIQNNAQYAGAQCQWYHLRIKLRRPPLNRTILVSCKFLRSSTISRI